MKSLINQIIQNAFEWKRQIRRKTNVGQRSTSSEDIWMKHLYSFPFLLRVPGLFTKPNEQEKLHTSWMDSLSFLMYFNNDFDLNFSKLYAYV